MTADLEVNATVLSRRWVHSGFCHKGCVRCALDCQTASTKVVNASTGNEYAGKEFFHTKGCEKVIEFTGFLGGLLDYLVTPQHCIQTASGLVEEPSRGLAAASHGNWSDIEHKIGMCACIIVRAAYHVFRSQFPDTNVVLIVTSDKKTSTVFPTPTLDRCRQKLEEQPSKSVAQALHFSERIEPLFYFHL